jgi:P-type conjugative transfer protein TrbL
MPSFNGVVAQFSVAGARYATAIQPYALKLFGALLFIEVLVTCLQFMLDQGDAPHYVGRLFRHVLSAGFIYFMIVNAFPWMTLVLRSFGQIGSAATGLPNLNPSTVVKIGGSMAETIFDTPASASLMPNIELAIVESVSAFFILLSFVIAAAALMLTLIESYLVIGGAALLLGFGASRWTASIAEGYFGYVVRVGTRLLFFYLVLGIGVQIATQWQTALNAACNPVATALPWYSTYGLPPKAIMTTVCSNAIPVRTMLDLAALSIVFLIVTLAVPYTAASIVSGTVGLALSHAFEAAYVAQTIVRPITSALQTGFNKVAQSGNGSAGNVDASGFSQKLTDAGQRTRVLTNFGPNGNSNGGVPCSTSLAPSSMRSFAGPKGTAMVSRHGGTAGVASKASSRTTLPLVGVTPCSLAIF